MKTNKILFIVLSALFFSSVFFEIKGQTTIPSNFYGINGWMPDYVGGPASPGPTCCSTGTNINGQLYNLTSAITYTNFGVKMLRYGGITNDINLPTVSQYTAFVDMCRTAKVEPIIQISFSNFILAARRNKCYNSG